MATDLPVSARSASTAILITGAGRSGTSLLTRGMAALGVDLGDRLRPAGGKNPTGFFEDLDFLSLSKRLVRQIGLNAGSIRLSDPQDWEQPGVRLLHDEAVALIRERFGETSLWGFKYSRSLRLFPFWETVFDELGMNVKCVIALRNPLSIARSRSQINPQRGRMVWNNLEWLTSVVPYLHRARARGFVVVDFDSLLADPARELKRVAGALGITLEAQQHAAINEFAGAFLQRGMRNSHYSQEDLRNNPQVSPLVTRTYAWLYRMAHDEAAMNDSGMWQDWECIRQEVADLAPILAEMEDLRNRLNRSLWNPATPAQAVAQTWRNWRSNRGS